MPLKRKQHTINEAAEDEIVQNDQPIEEIPQEEAYDYNNEYDSEPSVEQDVELEPQVLNNEFKNVKLYDYFVSLHRYMLTFIKVYDSVQMDMVSSDDYNRIYKTYTGLKKYIDDIEFYMKEEYEDNDYNKNVYTYLLYNKAFAEIVSKFRSILKLTSEDKKSSK